MLFFTCFLVFYAFSSDICTILRIKKAVATSTAFCTGNNHRLVHLKLSPNSEIMTYAIPLAITGPAATPFKKTTPRIVPMTSITVTCGTAASCEMPYLERTATKIPHATAIQPAGVLKALNMSCSVILPVAIGTRIAIEIIVTPQLIPFACKTENHLSAKGSNLITATTMHAMINELFLPKNAAKKTKKRNNHASIISPAFKYRVSKIYYNFHSAMKLRK